MSDGIRSGVNWMRLKLRFSDVGQRADHQRLGQARHADQQAVAAGEDGDEQLLEDALLADDDLAQLGLEPGEAVVEPLDGGEVVVRDGSGGGLSSATRDLLWSRVRRPRRGNRGGTGPARWADARPQP